MFEILWVLELLTGAPYWDSAKTVLQNLAVLNLAPKCSKVLRTIRYFHFYLHLPMYQKIGNFDTAQVRIYCPVKVAECSKVLRTFGALNIARFKSDPPLEKNRFLLVP